MTKYDFEKDFRRHKMISRTMFTALGIYIASWLPEAILGERNKYIGSIRNDPLITNSTELATCLDECKKELGIENVKTDLIITNNMLDFSAQCMVIGSNHYELIVSIDYRKKWVLEHECFHVYEFEKKGLRIKKRLFRIFDYFPAEWRAQNYCLRNHLENKTTSSQEIGMTK
jgi:hypothetical protein